MADDTDHHKPFSFESCLIVCVQMSRQLSAFVVHVVYDKFTSQHTRQTREMKSESVWTYMSQREGTRRSETVFILLNVVFVPHYRDLENTCCRRLQMTGTLEDNIKIIVKGQGGEDPVQCRDFVRRVTNLRSYIKDEEFLDT